MEWAKTTPSNNSFVFVPVGCNFWTNYTKNTHFGFIRFLLDTRYYLEYIYIHTLPLFAAGLGHRSVFFLGLATWKFPLLTAVGLESTSVIGTHRNLLFIPRQDRVQTDKKNSR